MRLRMKTTMAGPGGSASPGQIIDVPEQDASALVSGGFAEYVERSVRHPETATISQAETAAKPRRGRR